MRTTIEISDELFRQLKRKAADKGTTIRNIVESALRVYLGKQPKRKGYQLNWKTERGRILPGIRLGDRAGHKLFFTAVSYRPVVFTSYLLIFIRIDDQKFSSDASSISRFVPSTHWTHLQR